MAPNIDDYLVFLRENASEIKSLGKQWGMNEDEIVSCVNEVLSRSPNLENKGHTLLNLARKLWRTYICLVKLSACVFLVLIAIIVGLHTAVTYHSPTAEYVSKAIQPHAYVILRFFRLAALPFHDVTNITKFYETECIVDNPFFVEDPPDCRPCSIFKKIKEADAATFPAEKFAAYVGADKPVLLKKTYDRNISYADLRKAYQGIKDGNEEDVNEFTSNDPAVPTLNVLFDEDQEDHLNASNSLHILWTFKSVRITDAMNDPFPRPSYIPEHADMILEKSIVLDSPKTGVYKLTGASGPAHLYTQAQGRRRILLRPIEACKSECSSLLVIMEAGDSLAYNNNLYNLFLSTNGDVLSIGYAIQFIV